MFQENRLPEGNAESLEFTGGEPGQEEVSSFLDRIESGQPIIDAADSTGRDRMVDAAKEKAIEGAVLAMQDLANFTNSMIGNLEAAWKDIVNNTNNRLQEESGGAAFYGLESDAVGDRANNLPNANDMSFLKKMEATRDIGMLPDSLGNCTGMIEEARGLRDRIEAEMPNMSGMKALQLKLNMTSAI